MFSLRRNLIRWNTNVQIHSWKWSIKIQRRWPRQRTCPSLGSAKRYYSCLKSFLAQKDSSQRETHSIWSSWSRLLELSEARWHWLECSLQLNMLWLTPRMSLLRTSLMQALREAGPRKKVWLRAPKRCLWWHTSVDAAWKDQGSKIYERLKGSCPKD